LIFFVKDTTLAARHSGSLLDCYYSDRVPGEILSHMSPTIRSKKT